MSLERSGFLNYSASDLSDRIWLLVRTVIAGVMMRGTDKACGSSFSCGDSEARIQVRHLLRKMRRAVIDAPSSSHGEVEAL